MDEPVASSRFLQLALQFVAEIGKAQELLEDQKLIQKSSHSPGPFSPRTCAPGVDNKRLGITATNVGRTVRGLNGPGCE